MAWTFIGAEVCWRFAGMESKTFFTIIVKERNPLFICVIYFVWGLSFYVAVNSMYLSLVTSRGLDF